MNLVMSAQARLLLLIGMLFALLSLARLGDASAQSTDKAAALFELEVLQGGESGALKDSLGKVVILEFWATYCGWCKATHPKLAAFAKDNADKVVVLGISAQKKRRLARYLKKHDTGLTILHDRKAQVSRNYRVSATPTLVVIDTKGKVRAWAQGGRELKSILRTAKLLASP